MGTITSTLIIVAILSVPASLALAWAAIHLTRQ
jgi:hypothetical protein